MFNTFLILIAIIFISWFCYMVFKILQLEIKITGHFNYYKNLKNKLPL